MRNRWKVAFASTLALGLWGALAQAQPLIAGNTAAFGCGPIVTSDFGSGTTVNSFIPDGAVAANCPNFANPNGRGLAIGGPEVYYTELAGLIINPDGTSQWGPTDHIHVANYNFGAGSADSHGRSPTRGLTAAFRT